MAAIRHTTVSGSRPGGGLGATQWDEDHSNPEFCYTLFASGGAQAYTIPTAATNAEAATAPMSRVGPIDLRQVSQARLCLAVRTVGVGYTTATLRLDYATTAQSTWAELANTANAGTISLMAGTAGALRFTSWFDIKAAAKAVDQVLRLLLVTTGTGTTAAIIASADLLVR